MVPFSESNSANRFNAGGRSASDKCIHTAESSIRSYVFCAWGRAVSAGKLALHHVTLLFELACARFLSSSAGSAAVTFQPCSASQLASRPLPAPTSSAVPALVFCRKQHPLNKIRFIKTKQFYCHYDALCHY